MFRRRLLTQQHESLGIFNFGYTGSVQSCTLPRGIYKLECWGAQGGIYNSSAKISGGGYSVGTINLTSETVLYIYVGGKGIGGNKNYTTHAGGFNGGGSANVQNNGGIGSGGGASDIRVGQDSLYARVIVAGGGGGFGYVGSNTTIPGGGGGGSAGVSAANYSNSAISYYGGGGGTQSQGGDSYYNSNKNNTTYGTLATFGAGGAYKSTYYQIAGGGGGWYGGGYGSSTGAGGGSGYVYTAETAENYPEGCLLNSSYYLSEAETKDAASLMPLPNGDSYKGRVGSGFVRITDITIPVATQTHDYVEIGGIKWATMNVGANSITDWGLFFQWGDIQGYNSGQTETATGLKPFAVADYKYAEINNNSVTMTKYNSSDNKKVLDTSDDAVAASWGGNWRMPTIDEFTTLLNNVDITNVSKYQGSDTDGYLLTDKTDSTKSLFFPSCGYKNSGAASNEQSGYYWSRTLANSEISACILLLMSSSANTRNTIYRQYGMNIRGILDE